MSKNPPKSGNKNLLGNFLFLIICSLIVFVISTIGQNFEFYLSPTTRALESIWTADIENLKNQHKLPIFWNDIRLIDKISAYGDPLAKEWARKVSAPIEINPTGKYKLEILFISQEDKSNLRAVVQHHIIHIPSHNSVWELGRTYKLK